MGTSFEELLKRMNNAPHNGVPKVTNPKVPTKVERDAAAFAERVKNNPIIPTNTGSQLDEILKRMKDSSHGGMVYADPAFGNNGQAISEDDFETWDALCGDFIEKKNADKAKRKHKSNNTPSVQNEQ